MIVYADPQFKCSYSELVDGLQQRAGSGALLGIDELRTLLIHAGQLEQGVSDLTDVSREWLVAVRTCTESATASFDTAWNAQSAPARIESYIAAKMKGLQE